MASKSVESRKYRNFKELLDIFCEEQENDIEEIENRVIYNQIDILPEFIYDQQYKEIKVEFSLGMKKEYYKIKDLTLFYDNMLDSKTYKYGDKFEFKHIEAAFKDRSKAILKFLLKQAEILKQVNCNTNIQKYKVPKLSTNYIVLNGTSLDEIFEILKGKTVDFKRNYKKEEIKLVERNPDIEFKLENSGENEFKLTTDLDINNSYELLKGKAYSYLITESKIYRCTKQFEDTTLKVVDVFKRNLTNEIVFNKSYFPAFFSRIMPRIEKNIEVDVDEEEIRNYIPEKLEVRLFLDYDDSGRIVMEIKFKYGETEFNPLDFKQKVEIARNTVAETESLNVIRKTGFMLDVENLRFILADNDSIYNFIHNEIDEYMSKYEVMITDNFKSKKIKTPQVSSVAVKVENDLLSIDLSKLDFDKSELKEILKRYTLKKKYHRLKDGTFLSLEDSEDLDFITSLMAGLDIGYKDIEKGNIVIPAYRSLYLNRLLKKFDNREIIKEKEFKDLVNNIEGKGKEENIIIPVSLEKILRYYQKTGYKWLKTLDNYRLGGILADDMGLGKTIQMLSVIVDYIARTNKNERKASIVISPSSLALNWESEAKKFANDLRVLVIHGRAEERQKQIENISKYDLVITSYELLKRDLETYKKMDYEFRYSIIDEAQYIKNSNTQNAKEIKEIKAETKYALTGTPIENSLSELWSIFDYIMPGYLFSYRKFKENFETPIIRDNDNSRMEKLKMLIEPFILRRTKKEVLKELPDKTITVLNNVMEEEQAKIYRTYLAMARNEIKEEIKQKGFGNSQIKILSLLTRLRQICCHPSLFISNYKDKSGKLEQCIDIVNEAVAGGHKILIFSGYTSMFDFMEEELKKLNINYFKLTGQTKVDERLNLVDEFNKNPDIKVFLISLKAGGTGLNLTGADMVIHYDPWWNISVENQATDRAYRIGQRNNVHVYKLITKDSIEEKIYELQERKSKLIDDVLSTETKFLSKFSEEDILSLFD